MYVARADSSCILNVYTLHGFSGQSLYKNIESLILSHSYGRRVSRMTDELVNVSRMAEWVRERPFDFNERAGWGGGEKMSSGCFFCDAILSFYSPLIQNVL